MNKALFGILLSIFSISACSMFRSDHFTGEWRMFVNSDGTVIPGNEASIKLTISKVDAFYDVQVKLPTIMPQAPRQGNFSERGGWAGFLQAQQEQSAQFALQMIRGQLAGKYTLTADGQAIEKLDQSVSFKYKNEGNMICTKNIGCFRKIGKAELQMIARAEAEAEAEAERAAAQARAEAQARHEAQVRAARIEWVAIPGGSFAMGYGADDGWSFAKPIHQVAVKPFQMAKTLVTVAQYKACVDAGACAAPATGGYCNWGVAGRDQHPVNCVDWNQAQAFSAWAGGRLPSESEWEYAARSAGKDWKYPWGDEAATCETAVISGCTSGGTEPVCSKPAGNTKQGLCDMAGNVWEWVQDWYHYSYNGAPTDGTAWESPAGSNRVGRGGSWDFDAGGARSALRSDVVPGFRGNVGFRPARRGP